MSELLAGAQIALPMELVHALTLLRIASQVMFALFLIGIILNFILLFMTLLVIKSRGWSIPLISLSLITAIMIGAGTIVGTVMSITAKYAVRLQSELNIEGTISVAMLVCMWFPTVACVITFFMHCALGCCLRPRRALMADVVAPSTAKTTTAAADGASRHGMMEDETRRTSTGVLRFSSDSKRASALMNRFRRGPGTMAAPAPSGSSAGSLESKNSDAQAEAAAAAAKSHVAAAPLR